MGKIILGENPKSDDLHLTAITFGTVTIFPDATSCRVNLE